MKQLKKGLFCLAFGFLVMSSRVFTEIRDAGDYIRCSVCVGCGAFAVSEWRRVHQETEGQEDAEGREEGR